MSAMSRDHGDPYYLLVKERSFHRLSGLCIPKIRGVPL
jgi:hypothetical protein